LCACEHGEGGGDKEDKANVNFAKRKRLRVFKREGERV
jgi:hypothetical protein